MQEPKWLSRLDYIKKYTEEMGLGTGTLSTVIAKRRVEVMVRPRRRGKWAKVTDGYRWPDSAGGGCSKVAVRNVPPPIEAKGFAARCVRCGAYPCESRGLYLDFNGKCRSCRRSKRLVGKGIDQAASADIVAFLRTTANGNKYRDDRNPMTAAKREANIQAHAARIEAMGLCGDGKDWI